MNWTDEEVAEAGRRWATSIRAVMDYAVELAAARHTGLPPEQLRVMAAGDSAMPPAVVQALLTMASKLEALEARRREDAARGGTMTAEQLESVVGTAEKALGPELRRMAMDQLEQHITAQGATVATLQEKAVDLERLVVERQQLHADELAARLAAEQENKALRAEVERMRAENHHLREDWTTTWRERAETAESRLAAIREALARELVQWSAERSWCRRCRTDTAQTVNLRVPHQHAASCPLWEGDAPQDVCEAVTDIQATVEELERVRRVGEGRLGHVALERDEAELTVRRMDNAAERGAIIDTENHERFQAVCSELREARAEVERLWSEAWGAAAVISLLVEETTENFRAAQHGALAALENPRLAAEVERLKARTWVQCTTSSNECLGGCRSMAEHDRYRATLLRERAESAEAEVERLKAENARLEHAHAQQAKIALHEIERRKAAESRFAAVREIVLKTRKVPLGAGESADGYDRGFGDGWVARGAKMRAELDALEGAAPQEAKDTCSVPEALAPVVIDSAIVRRGRERIDHLRKREHRWRAAGDVAAASEFREQADLIEYVITGKRPTRPDATELGPERVKEKSEAVIAAAASLGNTACGLAERCDHGLPVDDDCDECSREADAISGRADDPHVFDAGAEAMRTACLEAVRHQLEVAGAMDVHETVKAAIMGAVP